MLLHASFKDMQLVQNKFTEAKFVITADPLSAKIFHLYRGCES